MLYINNPALRDRMTGLMINKFMDAEGLIVKIGLDEYRVQRSDYYAMELEAMVQRGHTYVVDLLPH